MDIILDKKTSTEALIKVKLKADDYQSKVEEKVKDYARKADIKGFRKGKIPTGVIRKMYGKSIKIDEINHLLSHAVQDYIKDNELQIIGEPLPNNQDADQLDWETQQEFDFEYNIGLVDEFKFDLSKKQKVNDYTIKVDKKTIDEAIENVLSQNGQMTNPETSVEGDSLFGEFTGDNSELNGTGVLDLKDLDKKSWKPFIGAKKGDQIQFDAKKLFKEDSKISQVTGIELDQLASFDGKITLTVKNVNRSVPAELNQELFDKVFGPKTVATEEEFRAKVEETMAANYQRETGHLLEKTIRDHFVNKTKIDIPSEFLKRWIKVSNENKVTDEDIEREFDAYVSELKWSLIKNRIVKDNDVKVENEDVVAKAKDQILEQLGGAAVAAQLKDNLDQFADNYLKAENGENYMQVFNQVTSEKTYSLIKESITLNSKAITVDEFRKLAAN